MYYGYVRNIRTKRTEDFLTADEQADTIRKMYPRCRVYEEIESSDPGEWPVLSGILSKLKKKDTLVVCDLVYFPLGLKDQGELIQFVFDRSAELHVLSYKILINDTYGKAFLSAVKKCAEIETNNRIERSIAGKEKASQKKDYHDGRPAKYSDNDISNAMRLLNGHSLQEVYEITGISKSTLSRAVRKNKREQE